MSRQYLSKAGYIRDCRVIDHADVRSCYDSTNKDACMVVFNIKGTNHNFYYSSRLEAEVALHSIYRAAQPIYFGWGWGFVGALALVGVEVYLSLYPLG